MLRLAMPRSHLRIRACASKGGRPRMVPLWCDRGTFDDMVAWRDERLARGAKPSEPFVSSWWLEREQVMFHCAHFASDFAQRVQY